MEFTRENKFKIGLFVAVGLTLLVTYIVILGSDGKLFVPTARLKTKMTEVPGLSKGSVVTLAGFNVGNVRTIDFTSEGLIISMAVDERYLHLITKSSNVEVRTQGALGDKFMYIEPGNPAEPALKDGDFIPLKKSSSFVDVLAEKGGETAKIFEIISEVHLLMKTLNQGQRIDTILENMSVASKSMRETAVHGEAAASAVQASMNKLDGILGKVHRGEGSLGAMINDPSIHDALKNMLVNPTKKTAVKGLMKQSLDEE